MTSNGWSEYQRLVLAELTRLDTNVTALREEVSALKVSVEVLRNRAVTWGALGGFIVWVTTVFGGFLIER
jgi:hypothetical protein|tara:strand:+ start:19574 stop:19783 length:210 start_codon:yes stop_codon:yes gene_type:complete